MAPKTERVIPNTSHRVLPGKVDHKVDRKSIANNANKTEVDVHLLNILDFFRWGPTSIRDGMFIRNISAS
jgi:hypothetical protein